MAESTLIAKMADLKSEIADYLRFTRDTALWDARKISQIGASLNTGLRQFYKPPLLPGMAAPWIWTFLKPTYSLSTVAGTDEYTLPDNFSTIENDITIISESLASPPVVRVISIERLLAYQQVGLTSGTPMFAAVQTVVSSGTAAPVYKLILFPNPDAVWVLKFRYGLIPNALSDAATYPLGSADHSQTIIASCVAAAEELYGGGKGPKWDTYIERLSVSVAADMRVGAPLYMGKNRNRSTWRRPLHSGYFASWDYNP